MTVPDDKMNEMLSAAVNGEPNPHKEFANEWKTLVAEVKEIADKGFVVSFPV